MNIDDFIHFVVDAIPVAQPRHRIGVVAGKARAFQAPREHPIHVFKLAVREAALIEFSALACPDLRDMQKDKFPIDGPLVVEIEVILPRPKNMTWKTKPMPSVLHTKRGDVDNYAKAVLDAMDGIFWQDDCQVSKLYVSKWIAAGGERPHVRVMVGPANSRRVPR